MGLFDKLGDIGTDLYHSTNLGDESLADRLGGAATDLYHGISGETASDAALEAAGIQQEGLGYAADINREMFDITRQDQMPWLESGGRALTQLEEMMGQAPTFDDYQQSDYSKFIQQQGLDALESKSRAQGYYNTGGSSREMMQYAQDIAGQDYQQYLQNYYNSLNPYQQLAGVGQQQANVMGQQGIKYGQQQGQTASNIANAQAGGVVGAANAQAQGMSNMLGIGALLYGGMNR